jgi:hypothetical protein
MRYLKLAWVFVIMMVVVSAAFNFSFGWRLGEHSHTVTAYVHDGWIYGVLSLAGDGLKIVMGVLTVVCLTAKRMPIGLRVSGSLICGFLFVCATAYSLNSAIGSISTNRTDMAGLREAKATNYDAVKSQLDRTQKELSWLDQEYRASAAIDADMAGLRQSSLWTRTAGCANPTVPESRSFCQRYSALQAELGTSKRAEELDAKTTRLREKLAGMGGAIIADPHAKMLHDLTGYDQPTIALAWLMLIVALVEGGSTLGPISLSMAHRALLNREEAAGATEQKPITLTASKFDPAYSSLPAAPRTPMRALEKIAGVEAKTAKTGETSDNSPEPESKELTLAIEENTRTPDPDGPGTPVPAPEEPVEEVAEDRANVIDHPAKKLLSQEHLTKADLRLDRRGTPRKHSRNRPKETCVSRWLDGFSPRQLNDEEITAGDGKFAAFWYHDYKKFCQQRGEKFFHLKRFSSLLRSELIDRGFDIPPSRGKDGKRKAGGQVFDIELNPVMVTARRRVA